MSMNLHNFLGFWLIKTKAKQHSGGLFMLMFMHSRLRNGTI